MPPLALKDNPPIRFPDLPIRGSGLNWYIAKVKSRQEKVLAFELLRMNVGYYLPMYTKTMRRQDTGKKRNSIMPVFPSYLPFECDEVPCWLLRSERVSAIMEVRNQEKFKSQLEYIYRCQSEQVVGSDPQAFVSGQAVKIVDGPCIGMVGRFVKRANGSALVLFVEGLGYAEIHVDEKKVIAIERHLNEEEKNAEF